MSDATALTDLWSPPISVFAPDMWVAKTKISSVAHLWLRLCPRWCGVGPLHARTHAEPQGS
jgi:hypothetical protein